jgi:hypothetical protein
VYLRSVSEGVSNPHWSLPLVILSNVILNEVKDLWRMPATSLANASTLPLPVVVRRTKRGHPGLDPGSIYFPLLPKEGLGEVIFDCGDDNIGSGLDCYYNQFSFIIRFHSPLLFPTTIPLTHPKIIFSSSIKNN